MARNHGPAQPQPSPSQPAQPASAPPKSLIVLLIASRKGSYFWSKMGVPDHAERAEMADSGTPSGPMQQRYELKSRPQTRLKWLILTSCPDQCNRSTSKKAVLRRA